MMARAQLATNRMQNRTKERTLRDFSEVINPVSIAFSPHGGRGSITASAEPILTDSTESAAAPATDTSASKTAPADDSDEAHLQSDTEEARELFEIPARCSPGL